MAVVVVLKFFAFVILDSCVLVNSIIVVLLYKMDKSIDVIATKFSRLFGAQSFLKDYV